MNDRFFPPWWTYPVEISFIIIGIGLLKKWKKNRDPNASPWDRTANNVQYLHSGLVFTFGGATGLIISIYQACTGWVAK